MDTTAQSKAHFLIQHSGVHALHACIVWCREVGQLQLGMLQGIIIALGQAIALSCPDFVDVLAQCKSSVCMAYVDCD